MSSNTNSATKVQPLRVIQTTDQGENVLIGRVNKQPNSPKKFKAASQEKLVCENVKNKGQENIDPENMISKQIFNESNAKEGNHLIINDGTACGKNKYRLPRRRQTERDEETLKENEELHDLLKDLKSENKNLKKMAEQVELLEEKLKELLSGDD